MADDVASVRSKLEARTLSYVAVTSSTAAAASSTAAYFESVQRALTETTAATSDDEADEDEDEGGCGDGPTTADAMPLVTPSNRSKRGADPSSEFDENGWVVMQHFWDIFPLARRWSAGKKNDKIVFESTPLPYAGTVPEKFTKHMMLHFTAKPGKCASLILALANQAQRHAVVGAISGPRVRKEFVERFTELVSAPDFRERLQRAIEQPRAPESKKLERELLCVLTQAGRRKPWGCFERQDVLPKLFAISDRQGVAASIFNTISLDDVHQVLTIRMGFPSTSNRGFPGFAGADETAAWEGGKSDPSVQQMVEALLNGGELTVNEDGGAKQDNKFAEGALQRNAAENPVATTTALARALQVIDEELFKLMPGKRATRAIFDCCEDDDEELRFADGFPGMGIFGVSLAAARVIETSSRKALHGHEQHWTTASPKLLAMYAHDEELFNELAMALETQISARVDWEVHVVHRAQKALHLPGPREALVTAGCGGALDDDEDKVLASLAVQLSAVTLGDHEHKPTCHEGEKGAIGCRGGYNRGHPVPASSIVQLVFADAIPEKAVLVGDHGDPWPCAGGKCKRHWNGDTMLKVKMIHPLPPHPFPSGEDEV